MAGETLLIRADASTQMGTGHVMRCLALAQAWQEAGGRAELLAADLEPRLELRLNAERVNVVRLVAEPGSARDAQDTAAIGRDLRASWLVVDGYRFDATYQQMIKEAGASLLFVDDNGHESHYHADLVLNQNIHAREALYARREPYTRLLLGTRYALLRREFWPWRGWQRQIPGVAHKVLITLGGADIHNHTLHTINALRRVELEGLQVVVVVGTSNPHYHELQAGLRACPFAIRLERNVSNMAPWLAWAEIAISAGGSTSWELAMMGLPSILVALADNQETAVHELAVSGAFLRLSKEDWDDAACLARNIDRLLCDREQRAALSRTASNLVDGYGADRVQVILNHIPGERKP